MKRSLLFAALAAFFLGSVGCFIPIYPSHPTERMEALLVTSEGYRQMKDEWKRFWFIDQPSHLTFDMVHGGLQ